MGNSELDTVGNEVNSFSDFAPFSDLAPEGAIVDGALVACTVGARVPLSLLPRVGACVAGTDGARVAAFPLLPLRFFLLRFFFCFLSLTPPSFFSDASCFSARASCRISCLVFLLVSSAIAPNRPPTATFI